MKNLLLALTIAVVSLASASAINPNEAFSALSHLLMAVMSGERGCVVFVDAIVEDKERDAIQDASIEMKGTYLNMVIPNYFNITIN